MSGNAHVTRPAVCSWDRRNASSFASLRLQMLHVISNDVSSSSMSNNVNPYSRSLSASAAGTNPTKEYARAQTTVFEPQTASTAATTLENNKLMELLPSNQSYFGKAIQLLFDTPLPFLVRHHNNNGTSKLNSNNNNDDEPISIHLRPPNPNETIYLLPRVYLRSFIEFLRSSILNSAISKQSNYSHDPTGNSHSSFTLDNDTIKSLASLSILSEQYSLYDFDADWIKWFGSLEGRWEKYYQESGRNCTSDEKKEEDGLLFASSSQEFIPISRPGAMDARLLSQCGHPLLLRRNIAVMMGGITPRDNEENVLSVNEEMREENLLQFLASDEKLSNDAAAAAANNGEDTQPKLAVSPVSLTFYEFVRSTLGVICEDGTSISFQPSKVQSFTGGGARNSSTLLLHHEQSSTVKAAGNKSSKDVDIPHPSAPQSSAPTAAVGSSSPTKQLQTPRPIEFQRRILTTASRSGTKKQHEINTPINSSPKKMSSYSKLMKEAMTSRKEEEGQPILIEEMMTCTVEIHPVEFRYVIVDPSLESNKPDASCVSGVALISRVSRVSEALNEFKRTVECQRSSSCVRLWSRSPCVGTVTMRGATARGDGYDLIDDGLLDGSEEEEEGLTVERWLRLDDGDVSSPAVVEILVEIRSNPSSRWVREPLELENRLQVGDYVDAQDTAHKWYEAIVREITPDTVKVHFFGWGSRWDAELPRRKGSTKKVSPPMPLWSKTSGWRHRIKAGQEVEVRQTASLAYRPKWYRATIIAVRRESDSPNEIVGGAELEMIGEGNKSPLKLLNGKRQVLVRVPQEKNNCTTPPPEKLFHDNGLPIVHPPFTRWIDLYGEEICEAGTHTKSSKQKDGPATVTYSMDSQRTQPVEVMKSFNNLHGAGFVRESLRGVPPAPGSVGLHNLGNSCYMNSILQCINHISPITQYFLKGDYTKHINKKNPLGSGGRVATAYASFLSEIWTGEYSILAPRMLKQTVGFFAPQFNNNYQHDSQEFCQYLMDGLHEDLNKVIEKPYVEHIEANGMKDEQAARESWKRHLLRHDSVFVDYTQGMHRSHLTCPKCGKESIKFDVYSSISLPLVPSKDRPSIPLKDCLDQFAAGEQLDEHNAWYCSTCKKHVCALKLITLWNTPDILVLHLKRFTFEKCPTHDGRLLRRKIEDKVDFPIDRLDLSSYILGPKHADAPPVYKLFGVSEHTGSTANSGHYTATVRNSKDGNWYRYNDSHVGSTSGDAAVTGGAYLLFYQREKGSLRWAGMERQMQMGMPDKDGFTEVQSKRKKK
ncbi:hypothetical protein ACHAWO_004785 [Cyclotella atomus]|uniref:ubiquitinyl hydrolase 1 n=1 Tax=Cyclotella atomus TaxID=382360 RepID=A0ABD3P2Z0_9STRA